MPEAKGSLRNKRSPLERQEELLILAKRLRDQKRIEGSLAHYFIASAIEGIAEVRRMSDSSPALAATSSRIEEIEKAHGLRKGEYWRQGNGPENYREQVAEYDRIVDEITAATFDEYDEPELGRMFRYDRPRYDALFEEGRRQVHEDRKSTH